MLLNCIILLYYALKRHKILYDIIPYHIILYDNMLYYVTLYFVMLHYAIVCTLPNSTELRLDWTWNKLSNLIAD